MERRYYMNTTLGYYDVTNKVLNNGYEYLDENRLINPKPMAFNYSELQWFKKNLYDFVYRSYPTIPKETLAQLKTITLDNLKTRPYIFTSYSDTFDEDVYLLKIKDARNVLYNVYLIKYQCMESIYKNGEISDHLLTEKIRFENEEWYRNFFTSEEDYDKNRFTDNKTEITKDNLANKSKFNTLVEDKKKEIYKTFEGRSYTLEQWKNFEEERYQIYKDKQNKKGFWKNPFG